MKKIDGDKIIAIILVILVIVVLSVDYFLKKVKSNEENKVSIVTDYNDFYTVDSCLYRVMTYINSKNNDDLLLVLNDEFKEKNNVENVLSLFNDIPNNSTFTSRKMYYKKLNDNITEYYVLGYLFPDKYYESMTEYFNSKSNLYFIVYLDSKNLTFSIEPYDGEIFTGGKNDG